MLSDSRALDIALIGGVRFDTAEPHAGGLETHSDVLARRLSARGHDVTVFAGCGSIELDPLCPYRAEPLVADPIDLSDAARRDVSMPPEQFMIEHDAYLDLFDRLTDRRFDVIQNNSLHYLPVTSQLACAMVHTLHTPPTPWLESAHRIGRRRTRQRSCTVSVSHDNAARWNGVADCVVHNGVDADMWEFGDGAGGYAFWSGRLVPEKGAHLAIAAARLAGVRLLLAGPAHDRRYFDEVLVPEFDDDCIYLGHCSSTDVARHLADAAVALVTPCWDEPFGLVVIEALACGTPVAAFDRGAVSELLDEQTGVCAEANDVAALAAAISTATELDRSACRRRACDRFTDDVMAARYEHIYRQLTT